MSSHEYVTKIAVLRQKVEEYGYIEKDDNYIPRKKSMIKKFIFNISVKMIIYISIPIVVFILLYIIKPTKENIDKDNNITKNIDWKKFSITTIIMSLLIIIPLFVYFYKKK